MRKENETKENKMKNKTKQNKTNKNKKQNKTSKQTNIQQIVNYLLSHLAIFVTRAYL